ncbi:MAG: DUF484 family protein [Pseudomonadota bacterium]
MAASEEDDLHAEVHHLRARLEELLERAHANEATQQRLQAVELDMLRRYPLEDLLRALTGEYPGKLGLQAATLHLCPPQAEISALGVNGRLPAGVYLAEVVPPEAIQLGAPDDESPTWFPGHGAPGSLALLPLHAGGQYLGIYALAGEAGRFQPDQGTAFLQRLAAMVATSLDNAINHARVEEMALSDPLTGLDNRRSLERRLAEAVARSRRQGRELACLLVDIDYFKAINDRHGHPAGDRVLVEVAEALAGAVRGGDALARYGGEEFAVLMDVEGPEAAAAAADRLRQSAATVRSPDGEPLSASVGLALLGAAEAGDALVARADAALYRAKEAGRDRVESGD